MPLGYSRHAYRVVTHIATISGEGLRPRERRPAGIQLPASQGQAMPVAYFSADVNNSTIAARTLTTNDGDAKEE
jgi:hypothetical protein